MAQSQQTTARDEALLRLRSGTTALAEGRIEQAAEDLVYAESVFRQIDDVEHAAESRATLAEVQRRNGAIDQAASSYERAIELYKEAGAPPAREAGVTLALGHIERQRGQLDRAWEHYYLALRLFEKAGSASGQASASLALGHVERIRGRLDRAAEYYGSARDLYRTAHDTFGEADAARGLADMLAGRTRFDEAEQAYQQALTLYRDARDRFGEADTLIGLGRLDIDRVRFDEAGTLFGQAITLADTIEYELGAADGTLGLAEVALHRGQLPQALAAAMKAQEAYSTAGSALGEAESNRALGEIQIRRGQLGQAITVFDRAARAFKTLRAHVPYARALLGSGEAQRRKANPRKAEDLFGEARTVGVETEHVAIEAIAALGLGRIARQRGQSAAAETLLEQSATRLEVAHRPGAAAQAMVDRAWLALTQGKLDLASGLAARARDLAAAEEQLTGEPGPITAATTVESAIALALSRLDVARLRAVDAIALSVRENDVLPHVDALLSRAQAELRSENLDAAVTTYNDVLKEAKANELAVAESLAGIGLARVLLRRGLWEEAALAHQEQVSRLRVADEAEALVLAQIGVAASRHGQGELAAARQSYVEAQRLASQSDAVLSQADALHGEARVLLDVPEIEAAVGRFTQALALIERVGDAVSDAHDRISFYDGRAMLYADAVYASAREQNAARAMELAQHYAGRSDKAGRAAAGQRLKDYEQSIPTRGADLTKEQIDQNKTIVRVLSDARQVLSR